MNEQSNINSSVYEFEFGLISTKPGSEIYLPLTKGAIENLEIEDSLAFFGYNGNCTINNFYGILQQLNMMDATSLNCLYISIKNKDLSKSKTDADASIAFLAFLTRGVESSTNIIDKGLTYSFEEYFVAKLRTESIWNLPNKENLKDTPGTLIHTLLKYSNKEAVDDISTSISTKNVFIKDAPNTCSLASFIKKDNTTLHSVITELYKYVTYTGDIAGPGLLTGATILKDGKLQRKLVLRPLAEYIQGFYKKYNQNAVDLHEYVTEEFVVGAASDASALNTNFIDNYSFIQVDQNDVFENKWVDSIVSSHGGEDITSSSTPTVRYENVKYDFANQMLDKNAVNLPSPIQRGKANRKIVYKSIDDVDDKLTIASVENTMKKSFIFDNRHLTFTVPGNTYRQSGKFIRIKYDSISTTINSRNKKDQVDGYWFIISVKHNFRGDFYTNEIICAKLHTYGKELPPGAANTADPTQQAIADAVVAAMALRKQNLTDEVGDKGVLDRAVATAADAQTARNPAYNAISTTQAPTEAPLPIGESMNNKPQIRGSSGVTFDNNSLQSFIGEAPTALSNNSSTLDTGSELPPLPNTIDGGASIPGLKIPQ